MSNPRKAQQIYEEVSRNLDDFVRGKKPTNLEDSVSRIPNLVSGGHIPKELPKYPLAIDILNSLVELSSIRSRRQKKKIAGGTRYVLTEDDAFDYLALARKVTNDLIIPGFSKKSDFSNSIFKDISNFGLAYLHSVVNAVATEYISYDDAVDSKLVAVDIAKQAIRVGDLYHNLKGNGFSKMRREGKKLSKKLQKVKRDFMRPFELTPVTPKKIYQGDQLMNNLSKILSGNNDFGEPEFLPEVIFPIAQGGNEFGLRIANAYENRGHNPLVYPLLYSIKTRKHKYPWIHNDIDFLGPNLEGKTFLITEDWVTTGNTLRGILNQLENTFPSEMRVATIKRDPEKSAVSILDRYKFYVGSWSVYSGNKTDSLSEQ